MADNAGDCMKTMSQATGFSASHTSVKLFSVWINGSDVELRIKQDRIGHDWWYDCNEKFSFLRVCGGQTILEKSALFRGAMASTSSLGAQGTTNSAEAQQFYYEFNEKLQGT